MSTALATVNQILAGVDFTAEQLKLITDTVAKGATKDELALFLYRAKSMELDPLKPGQIYFIKYGGQANIVIGIEGFRCKAAKTGKLSGISRGVIKDEKGKLTGAWAEAHRKDWTHPAREEVPLVEYDSGRGNWKTMPETMIKKVAEAAVLRMAFADDLGGIYLEEELEHNKPAIGNERVVADTPGPNDGIHDPDAYMIPYGPFARMTLDRAHETPERRAKLEIYLQEVNDKSLKLKKPLPAWARELFERVQAFRELEASMTAEEPGWDG